MYSGSAYCVHPLKWDCANLSQQSAHKSDQLIDMSILRCPSYWKTDATHKTEWHAYLGLPAAASARSLHSLLILVTEEGTGCRKYSRDNWSTYLLRMGCCLICTQSHGWHHADTHWAHASVCMLTVCKGQSKHAQGQNHKCMASHKQDVLCPM